MTPRRPASPLARTFLAALAAGVLALGHGGPAARADGPLGPPPVEEGAEQDLRPREVRGLQLVNTLGEKIPLDLTFTNVDGQRVKLAEFFNRPSSIRGVNKPLVLMMVYYRCPILCPMVLEKFTKTLNEIDYTVGSEYDALVISFDGRDTHEDAVRERANQLLFYRQPTTETIRNGWTFLSCHEQPRQADALAEALGFQYRFIESNREFAHGDAVYILTPDGTIARTLTGLNYPAKDVRLALLEASEGKIGTIFDRFTLWCYHFDPAAGSYALQALRVMQVGASLAAVLLGGFIFTLLRWERAKKRRLADGAAAAARGPGSHTIDRIRSMGLTGHTP